MFSQEAGHRNTGETISGLISGIEVLSSVAVVLGQASVKADVPFPIAGL